MPGFIILDKSRACTQYTRVIYTYLHAGYTKSPDILVQLTLLPKIPAPTHPTYLVIPHLLLQTPIKPMKKTSIFSLKKTKRGVSAAPFFLSLNIYLFHVWAREKSPVIMLRFDRDCPQLYFYKLKFVNELKPD